MKKILYPVLALGAIATLASCASDEPINVKEYDGTARFSIRLPDELATRFNDGEIANKLYYSVFQDGKYVLDGVITDAFSNNLTQEVGIQLVANQEYQIVFFADNATSESNGYTYNPQTAQFGVTYSNDMVNSDNFDAFVNTITYKATGEGTDVPLKRPFAQLNIGTNDLDNGAVTHIGLENFSSTLTIQPTNILSGINFLSGKETKYSGEALSFSIPSFASLPADAFPVDNYKYIEMNYLLVPATGEGQNSLIDATYVIEANGTTGNTLNLASTPVKTNYQTNVYGSLLTTRNKFNIEIKPTFDGGWNNEAVVVKTPEEFHDAILAGKPVYVAEGTTLDLTSLPATSPDNEYPPRIEYDKPATIVIDGTITNIKKSIYFNQGLKLTGNGALEFDLATIRNSAFTATGSSNVVIEGVTIRGINSPIQSTDGVPLVWIDNPSSLVMNGVTVDNPHGSAIILSTNKNTMISGCSFNAKYGDKGDRSQFYYGVQIEGSGKFTFDKCEVTGPMGILNMPTNTMPVELTFSNGSIVSTEEVVNLETGPAGIAVLMGNGSAKITNSYIYAVSGYLTCIMSVFNYANHISFTDCFVNDGQNYEVGETEQIVPVSDGFTFTDITPVSKTFAGNTYTFTKKLSGNH